jgi:hypothetical protein
MKGSTNYSGPSYTVPRYLNGFSTTTLSLTAPPGCCYYPSVVEPAKVEGKADMKTTNLMSSQHIPRDPGYSRAAPLQSLGHRYSILATTLPYLRPFCPLTYAIVWFSHRLVGAELPVVQRAALIEPHSGTGPARARVGVRDVWSVTSPCGPTRRRRGQPEQARCCHVRPSTADSKVRLDADFV